MSDKKNFDKKRYWLEKEAHYIKIKQSHYNHKQNYFTVFKF